jgi:hypothetical protein
MPVLFLSLFLVFSAGALWSQSNGEATPLQDPSQLLGFTLGMVYARCGVPESVYPVRGVEEWQDDVVFVYTDWDLYIYRDRVWQLGVKSAFGISLGDPQGVVSLVLGEGMEVFDGYVLCSLPSHSWPLQLRVNLDAAGKVSAIFIYRSDF